MIEKEVIYPNCPDRWECKNSTSSSRVLCQCEINNLLGFDEVEEPTTYSYMTNRELLDEMNQKLDVIIELIKGMNAT